MKTGFMAPGLGVSAIFYDPGYAKHTPTQLWLATGMRAVDHAVETFYHPYASEMPWKALSMWALGVLFECLPKAKSSHPNDEGVMMRLMLAAFASSGIRGKNVKGGMGLSHSLGYALGSPYGIPRKYSREFCTPTAASLQDKQSYVPKQSLRHFTVFYLQPATVVAVNYTSRRSPIQGQK